MGDLIKKIKQLESQGILEIIDDNGISDMTCRFVYPFFRESLYQKLLFRDQKKGLHTLAAEYFQNNTIRLDEDPKQETQKMVMHMLVSEEQKASQLSAKAKRMITIKEVTNKLLNANQTIKTGSLLKQGQKISGKISKYIYIYIFIYYTI